MGDINDDIYEQILSDIERYNNKYTELSDYRQLSNDEINQIKNNKGNNNGNDSENYSYIDIGDLAKKLSASKIGWPSNCVKTKIHDWDITIIPKNIVLYKGVKQTYDYDDDNENIWFGNLSVAINYAMQYSNVKPYFPIGIKNNSRIQIFKLEQNLVLFDIDSVNNFNKLKLMIDDSNQDVHYAFNAEISTIPNYPGPFATLKNIKNKNYVRRHSTKYIDMIIANFLCSTFNFDGWSSIYNPLVPFNSEILVCHKSKNNITKLPIEITINPDLSISKYSTQK